MKYLKQLQQAAVIVTPVALATSLFLRQHLKIRGLTYRSNYMEEKLYSAMEKLTPEKLEELEAEVDADITFIEMSQTTLRDTL